MNEYVEDNVKYTDKEIEGTVSEMIRDTIENVGEVARYICIILTYNHCKNGGKR